MVYIGRLLHPRLTIFDRTYGYSHQSLDRNHIAGCDVVHENQRTYELLRLQHAFTVARVNERNSSIPVALLPRPTYTPGGWVGVYNIAAIIR